MSTGEPTGAWLPAHVLAADVSADAKILAGRVYALSKVDGYCYASNGYFAEEFGVSERTVKRWLRELTDHGPPLVRRELTSRPKGGSTRRLFPVWPGSEAERTDLSLRAEEAAQLAFSEQLAERTDLSPRKPAESRRDTSVPSPGGHICPVPEGTDLSPVVVEGVKEVGIDIQVKDAGEAGATETGAELVPTSAEGEDLAAAQRGALEKIWNADAEEGPRTLASYAVGFWMETRRSSPPEEERKKQFEAFRRAFLEAYEALRPEDPAPSLPRPGDPSADAIPVGGKA